MKHESTGSWKPTTADIHLIPYVHPAPLCMMYGVWLRSSRYEDTCGKEVLSPAREMGFFAISILAPTILTIVTRHGSPHIGAAARWHAANIYNQYSAQSYSAGLRADAW